MNMVDFASDGARIMTGRNNGVGAKLKWLQPSLTCVHVCVTVLLWQLLKLEKMIHIYI